MGIRTKFNPMGGGKTKKRYKAYILYYSGGIRKVDVSALGFTENIDPDTTFAPTTGYVGSTSSFINYIVLNGKLYNYSGILTQIGDLDNWTSITTYSTYNSGYLGYGIAGGALYRISGSSVSQVDNTRIWLDVSSLAYQGSSSYAFGIFSNSTYTKMAASINYRNTISNCRSNTDFITGSYTTDVDNLQYYGYAIANNTAYLLVNNTYETLRGNVSAPSMAQISAGSSANSIAASATPYATSFGITTDGKLVAFCGVCFNQPTSGTASGTGWTNTTGVSNTFSGTYYGLGIKNGELYMLSASGSRVSSLSVYVQKLGNITTWTDVCGCLKRNGDYYALGITDGKVYTIASELSSFTIADTGLTKCTAIYGFVNSTRSIGLAICEA